MPGIVGQATSFNVPNYVGELFNASPQDTPLLSAIGGLTGGKPTNSVPFTWSGYDLRDPEARPRLEGDDAPDAEHRTRFQVQNVVQIHHEAVDISYTKQATAGQVSEVSTQARAAGTVGARNAVQDEYAWQIRQSLVQAARDIEFSFHNGVYAFPEDNNEARRTRGIRPAITTNVVDADGDPLDKEVVLDAMQEAWASGGLSVEETRTVLAGAWQKRELTRVFVSEAGYQEASRNVGGVNVTTVETDFGKLNIMLDRYMPDDELVFASLEQLAPRFLLIPDKGFLFVEKLAKTGASEAAQLYGEIGLEYGNEKAHAKITGLETQSSGS